MAEHGPAYYYPNRMARIILLATEEIIGAEAAHKVLNGSALPGLAAEPPDNLELSVPFASISGLQSALDDLYGPGGRGIALRVGRACFQQGLQEFGPSAGLTELGFRLLQLNTKLKAGADGLAAIFNRHTDQRVRVEQDEERIYWRIERCPVCWARRTSSSCCHLAIGVLEEALYWASNGRNFKIEEIACTACGDDACVIAIDRTPLS